MYERKHLEAARVMGNHNSSGNDGKVNINGYPVSLLVFVVEVLKEDIENDGPICKELKKMLGVKE